MVKIKSCELSTLLSQIMYICVLFNMKSPQLSGRDMNKFYFLNLCYCSDN